MATARATRMRTVSAGPIRPRHDARPRVEPLSSEEKDMNRNTILALCAAVLCLGTVAPDARAAGDVTCKMNYTLTGWSVLYKHAEGRGTVHCSNGQQMSVKLSAKGGGLTVGKYKITNGFGEFAGVENIDDVLGTYVAASADAAAVKAGTAQAMTKGDVSLALSGTGKGVNLGVALTGFTISR
jgi:hypothetical protein